ncbi:MAG TPA: Holliday junction resolvase RuvX [Candidatus Limnocylindria bacterium]|nr:Holliday junction resolvase RuvX [Candidatus Limnocylindria bacterium]
MGRLLGLDYGDRRVGVALSDPQGRLATPWGVIPHRGWGPTAREVLRLLRETGAEYVVLGLPRSMDDSLGAQAREAMGFAGRLRELGARVEYSDERLSTVEAGERLRALGLTARESRDKVDQSAAAIILQQYLDRAAGSDDTDRRDAKVTDNMDRNAAQQPEDTDSNIVELTDEDGVTTQFEYLSTIEHKGESYVVLLAPQDEGAENEDEGEVVILKIQQDEKGEDTYVSCDSDELEQEVFDIFMDEMDEEEDEDLLEEAEELEEGEGTQQE